MFWSVLSPRLWLGWGRGPDSFFCISMFSCPSTICAGSRGTDSFPHLIILAKINWPSTWGFISGHSFPFRWFLCLALCQHCTVWVAVASFSSGCLLLLFLAGFLWPEPPVQCWTQVARADVIVLFLTFGGKSSVFQHWVWYQPWAFLDALCRVEDVPAHP